MTKKNKEKLELKDANQSNENLINDDDQEPKTETCRMFLNYYEKIEFNFSNKNIWGYPTQFKEYDELTGGLQKSELTVVAARHSMGKTTFITNLASSLASQKIPVLYISYKLSEEKIINRFIASEAEVDNMRIKQNCLRTEDWEKIADTMNKLIPASENSFLQILGECSLSYKELFDKIRDFKTQNNDGVVLIDDFQLIPLTGNEDRYVELSALACSFKRLAIEIKLPIVITAQVSRKCNERNNKRPQLSDLAECDALAQYSDNLLFIYRDDYYSSNDDDDFVPTKKGIAEIIIAKQKNGPKGKFELLYQENIYKFKNKVNILGDF